MSAEENKELARLWILEGWNKNRNQEVIERVFAQNWVDGNPAFPDQPQPTGKRVKFTGIVIHRVEDGRFAESWNEIDLLGLKSQLESS